MTRFFGFAGLLLVLIVVTHLGRVAARDGWGLEDELADVSVRNGSTGTRGRTYVGGGFHGGK